MRTSAGDSINYVHLQGNEFGWCIDCGKKIMFTYLGILISPQADTSMKQQTSDVLSKIAADRTILFRGEDAELQVS